MKLCKDCLYYLGNDDCVKQPNIVTGRPASGWRSSCKLQREDGWFSRFMNNSCGKSGKFWKPKDALKAN